MKEHDALQHSVDGGGAPEAAYLAIAASAAAAVDSAAGLSSFCASSSSVAQLIWKEVAWGRQAGGMESMGEEEGAAAGGAVCAWTPAATAKTRRERSSAKERCRGSAIFFVLRALTRG